MRDPKRDPAAGDLIDDGEGWTYEVVSAGPDEKGRNRVAFIVRWTYEGEARAEVRDNALGAWRHRWRTE